MLNQNCYSFPLIAVPCVMFVLFVAILIICDFVYKYVCWCVRVVMCDYFAMLMTVFEMLLILFCCPSLCFSFSLYSVIRAVVCYVVPLLCFISVSFPEPIVRLRSPEYYQKADEE